MNQQVQPLIDVGTTLAAAAALQHQHTGVWTNQQVAYLLQLAYDTGRAHAGGEDLAESIACWARHQPPAVTWEQRVQHRLDDMTRRYGQPRHPGGPVNWDTGRPLSGGGWA